MLFSENKNASRKESSKLKGYALLSITLLCSTALSSKAMDAPNDQQQQDDQSHQAQILDDRRIRQESDTLTFESLKLAADQGDRDAQFQLGNEYRYGYQRNDTQAFAYMKLAADQGHSLAPHFLGALYLNGIGTEPNFLLSSKYFQISVDNGLFREADLKILTAINSFLPLVEVITDHNVRIVFFKILQVMPNDDRLDFVNFILSLFMGAENENVKDRLSAHLNQVFGKIFPENLSDFVRAGSFLLSNLDKITTGGKIISLLGIKHFESEERIRFIKIALPILQNIPPRAHYSFLRSLEYTPESEREKIISACLNFKQEDESEFYESLFSSHGSGFLRILMTRDNSIKESLFGAWQVILQSSSIMNVNKFSKFILSDYHNFGLFPEHDLYQQAIRSSILVETINDPLNPFKFYENLIAKSKEPIDFDALKTPQEMISGCTVSLNPVYLLKFPRQGVQFGDLPDYNKLFLNEMIAGLDLKRINNNLRFPFEVEQATSFGYDALKQGSLGSNHLLNLLNIQGEQSDLAPIIASKFIACVAYLTSLSNEVSEGQFFSPREDAFLKMLSIIQACSTGKESGVIDYYVSLPRESKLKTISAETYEAEEERRIGKAKEFLNAIIAQEVEKILSNTENRFYKTLVGGKLDEMTAQGVHQELYVKNLIGPDVALLHSLTFDMHTQHLYENMVNKSKQEVIQIFYNYFVPHILIDNVVKEVNAALQKEKNTEYMALAEFTDPDMQERSWDFDIKSGKISITEFGAVHLLQKLSALKLN